MGQVLTLTHPSFSTTNSVIISRRSPVTVTIVVAVAVTVAAVRLSMANVGSAHP